MLNKIIRYASQARCDDGIARSLYRYIVAVLEYLGTSVRTKEIIRLDLRIEQGVLYNTYNIISPTSPKLTAVQYNISTQLISHGPTRGVSYVGSYY